MQRFGTLPAGIAFLKPQIAAGDRNLNRGPNRGCTMRHCSSTASYPVKWRLWSSMAASSSATRVWCFHGWRSCQTAVG
jgi:hypothetical protein